MDWIKIKVSHVLNTPLTDEEIGRLVRIQALVANKERHPSDAELFTIIRPTTVEKLAKKLQSFGEYLPAIVNKVLEDVEKSAKNKEQTRERVAKFRENLLGKSCLIGENVTLPVTLIGNDAVTVPHVTRDTREAKQSREEIREASKLANAHAHEEQPPAAGLYEFFVLETAEKLVDLLVEVENFKFKKSKADYIGHLVRAAKANPDEVKNWESRIETLLQKRAGIEDSKRRAEQEEAEKQRNELESRTQRERQKQLLEKFESLPESHPVRIEAERRISDMPEFMPRQVKIAQVMGELEGVFEHDS